MHFRDTIDGSRALHTKVRGRVTWRSGSKSSNGTGDEKAKAVLQSQVQDVMQTWMSNRSSERSNFKPAYNNPAVHKRIIEHRPVMLIFRAKATLASPTALSKAL